MAKRNPNSDHGETLAAISKAGADLKAELRDAALAKMKNKYKYTQDDVYRVMRDLSEYAEEQKKNNKPLTVAGFIMASKLPERTWYEAKDGRLDDITAIYAFDHDEYVDPDTGETLPLVTMSHVCKNAYLLIQAQLEGNCYTNRGNPAGSIFGLKAQFGWSDDNAPQHVVQNLVIADPEQAKKAMQMLAEP